MTRWGDLLRRGEARTRPVEEASAAAAARRWAGLPEHVKTPGQLVGRRSTGCEGTHGVFPACDFACRPCYHSRDANKVRVDGPHTVAEVSRQMAFLRAERGPTAYAQLIGGEVTLLGPEHHAAALETMEAQGRVPMSMTHGDFDDGYLRQLVLRPDGTRRFRAVSFAAHIDSTMFGRHGAKKPRTEAELHGHRERFCAMFGRLRAEHGVRAYLAHNMTVTPRNLGEVADVVRRSRSQGWRMLSFQPAAFLGDDRRWSDGFRSMTDEDVWTEIGRGAGRALPYRALQFGDTRCNRTTWGAFVGERYVPLLDEDDPADLAARDAFLAALPGNYLGERSGAVKAVRMARLLAGDPRLIGVAGRFGARFVRRAGGLWALRRGLRPVTFVMHSFMDAAVVRPAWELLQRGERATDPALVAAQERLEACVYAMAHPETGQIVPACAQHSVLDEDENRRLVVELALPGGAEPVFDLALRPVKDRALGPAADVLSPRVSAWQVTAVSLVCCVGAGVGAALGGPWWWAVGLWLFGRAADGLDGLVARRRGAASDLGGYLDMLADTVGYAAVPIGVAVGAGDIAVWSAATVLLASFYLNTMSWAYLSALLEKRGAGVATSTEPTSIRMPAGLVEGTETIVLFTVLLAWPASATSVFTLMAVLVTVTVLQRLRWAVAVLR